MTLTIDDLLARLSPEQVSDASLERLLARFRPDEPFALLTSGASRRDAQTAAIVNATEAARAPEPSFPRPRSALTHPSPPRRTTMWIVHPDGFFSVVRKRGDTQLTIRARVRADLERLRERWLPELGPTRAGEGSDYPYRASVEPEAFGRGLAELGASISYPNFKSEVARARGHERAHAYGKVWGALYRLEQRVEKQERQREQEHERGERQERHPDGGER